MHRSAALDFSFARVGAMVRRYWFLLRSSWPRILDLIYWPTVQMLMWGFLQLYVAQNAGFFARAAVQTARDVGARAIIAWSKGGLAARLLSRERPSVPILTPTRSQESYNRLALPYGVRPILAPNGRITRTQLESRIGPVDDRSLLLTMRHQAGDGRRIPLMALVRVGDTQEWSRDPDPS